MGRPLAEILRRHPARSVVIGCGIGCVAASRWLVPSWLALLGGIFMIFGGGMIPWLRELSAHPQEGFRLLTRDPVDTESSTRMVAEATEERDAGVAPQLDNAEVDVFPNVLAADAAFRYLLRPRGADDKPLPGATLHLYLHDARTGELLPVFEAEPDPLNRWPVGSGAVGRAYERATAVILVTPEELEEANEDLTVDQYEKYVSRTAVVAVPVFNRRDEVIAVLSASTQTVLPAQDNEQIEELLDWVTTIAEAASRVLVDLLAWYSETPLVEDD